MSFFGWKSMSGAWCPVVLLIQTSWKGPSSCRHSEYVLPPFWLCPPTWYAHSECAPHLKQTFVSVCHCDVDFLNVSSHLMCSFWVCPLFWNRLLYLFVSVMYICLSLWCRLFECVLPLNVHILNVSYTWRWHFGCISHFFVVILLMSFIVV